MSEGVYRDYGLHHHEHYHQNGLQGHDDLHSHHNDNGQNQQKNRNDQQRLGNLNDQSSQWSQDDQVHHWTQDDQHHRWSYNAPSGHRSYTPSAPPHPHFESSPYVIEESVIESPAKVSARIFALSDGLWRDLRDRHDREGFGELPLAALLNDEAVLACMKSEEIDILRSRLRTQPQRPDVIDFAELSALLGNALLLCSSLNTYI